LSSWVTIDFSRAVLLNGFNLVLRNICKIFAHMFEGWFSEEIKLFISYQCSMFILACNWI